MGDVPIVTDIGAVTDCWGDISVHVLVTELEGMGLSSTLLSTGPGFLLFAAGPLPLRPVPFGISTVANLVRFGADLTFLYEAIN